MPKPITGDLYSETGGKSNWFSVHGGLFGRRQRPRMSDPGTKVEPVGKKRFARVRNKVSGGEFSLHSGYCGRCWAESKRKRLQ